MPKVLGSFQVNNKFTVMIKTNGKKIPINKILFLKKIIKNTAINKIHW